MFLHDGNGAVSPDVPPILLYGAGKDVSEFDHWGAFAKRPGVREVRSPERLLEQVSFCLHRALISMPESHRSTLKDLQNANEVLHGKTVMIVDDDMRNIFALTSLLEDRGMNIVSHDNGRDAITALHAQPNVEAILMDIMMPEMDGIDTIREIRQIPACRDTPIIAVTAKAMKGDREKCMEAGAWDYLSKPVDTELMLGCLRGWLSR
jgi:CheY-like chemotaxis protein